MTGAAQPALTRNEGLDALRTLAAAAVLLSHASAVAGLDLHPLPTGTMGVGLFFVLSGYLIADQLARHPDDLRGYAIRRLARIYPAYWLAVLVIGIWTASPSFAADPLGYILMLHPMRDDILTVAWTLQVELLFYAAAPLLLRLSTRWWIAIATASFIFAFAVTHDGSTLMRTFPANLWRFFPGMLVARYPGRTLPVVLALPLLVPPMLQGDRAGGMHLDPWTAVAGGILVAACVAKPIRVRGAVVGASLSYAVYLWHFDVIAHSPSVLLGVVLTLAIAVVSWRLIEEPAIRLGAKLARRLGHQPPDAERVVDVVVVVPIEP